MNVPFDQDCLRLAREAYGKLFPSLPAWLDREQVRLEAELGAWHGACTWDGSTKRSFWIYYQAWSHGVEELRRQAGRRGTARHRALSWQAPLERASARSYEEPAFSTAGAEAMQVRRSLYRLTSKEQAVLEGCYWQGKTLAEVGKSLGMTESGAYYVRQRALAKLRRELEEGARDD